METKKSCPRRPSGRLSQAPATQVAKVGLEGARKGFMPIWRSECMRSPYGFLAWEQLFLMASQSQDRVEAAFLVNSEIANSCAFTKTQARRARGWLGLEQEEEGWQEAARLLELAKRTQPTQPALFERAARMYERLYWSDPGAVDAIENAASGGIAWELSGQIDREVALLSSVVESYPSKKQVPVFCANRANAPQVRALGEVMGLLARALQKQGKSSDAGEMWLRRAGLGGEAEEARKDAVCRAISLLSSAPVNASLDNARWLAIGLGAECR